MSLFQKIDLILHSGNKSDFKIECDSLSDEDLETLAYLISKKFTFDVPSGVPQGGLRIAKALNKFKTPGSGIILIVDDVLTTGNSMEQHKKHWILDNQIDEEIIRGVVIFARGKCPSWITPIFQMWKHL